MNLSFFRDKEYAQAFCCITSGIFLGSVCYYWVGQTGFTINALGVIYGGAFLHEYGREILEVLMKGEERKK